MHWGEKDWPVVAFVISFLLLELAEEVVEPGVDDPDAVGVVQRRLRLFQQRLEAIRKDPSVITMELISWGRKKSYPNDGCTYPLSSQVFCSQGLT